MAVKRHLALANKCPASSEEVNVQRFTGLICRKHAREGFGPAAFSTVVRKTRRRVPNVIARRGLHPAPGVNKRL
jgi:hypothetical protein